MCQDLLQTLTVPGFVCVGEWGALLHQDLTVPGSVRAGEWVRGQFGGGGLSTAVVLDAPSCRDAVQLQGVHAAREDPE